MKKIETQIVIESDAEVIWKTLMDFDEYPKWNPFIKMISGGKKAGEKLEVKIQPPEQNGMTFKPVIMKSDANKEFRWIGKLLFKGLFDGEHYFLLHDNNDGTTTLIHGEVFSGILVGLLSSALQKTEEGFALMNNALKHKIEKS